jgi:hypothetical protein
MLIFDFFLYFFYFAYTSKSIGELNSCEILISW